MTDSELVAWAALKYRERRPALAPAIDAMLARLDAGSLTPASQPGFAQAVADIQAFLNDLAAAIPVVQAQLAAVAGRSTPLPPP